MSTVVIKNTMVMNNTEKKADLVERFKNISWIMQRFCGGFCRDVWKWLCGSTDHERCKTFCIC
mgnify:CR=1 FL=1